MDVGATVISPPYKKKNKTPKHTQGKICIGSRNSLDAANPRVSKLLTLAFPPGGQEESTNPVRPRVRFRSATPQELHTCTAVNLGRERVRVRGQAAAGCWPPGPREG